MIFFYIQGIKMQLKEYLEKYKPLITNKDIEILKEYKKEQNFIKKLEELKNTYKNKEMYLIKLEDNWENIKKKYPSFTFASPPDIAYVKNSKYCLTPEYNVFYDIELETFLLNNNNKFKTFVFIYINKEKKIIKEFFFEEWMLKNIKKI